MSKPIARTKVFRFLFFGVILLGCGYILNLGTSYDEYKYNGGNELSNKSSENQKVSIDKLSSNEGFVSLSSESEVNKESLHTLKEIKSEKIKATFVTLARNSDLNSILDSIRQVEDRFNHQYQYDWVFLNDNEFTEEFKQATTAKCSGKTKYGLIPKEHWSYPDWISKEEAALTRERMKDVIYGSSESYRHMCRYESGFFWRHELMEEYEYYWRVEPDIKIYCDIDYDIFKFMKDNNKKYSFTISLAEFPKTIPTLWETTKKFIAENKKYLAEDNLMEWISPDNGETYNGCHFWSNFEIASLDFWRSDAYRDYFQALDKAGGFFYERWGDAPVHSIAVALFMPRDQVHFFDNVGYYHNPFHNCPIDSSIRLEKNCLCDPSKDFSWTKYSCTTRFYRVNNIEKPAGAENYLS